MTSKPLVRRTLATLRIAEFGFFGVVVYTRVHTPRRCGQFCSAGEALLYVFGLRGLRTNWLTVAIRCRIPYETQGQTGKNRPAQKRKFNTESRTFTSIRAAVAPCARTRSASLRLISIV